MYTLFHKTSLNNQLRISVGDSVFELLCVHITTVLQVFKILFSVLETGGLDPKWPHLPTKVTGMHYSIRVLLSQVCIQAMHKNMHAL